MNLLRKILQATQGQLLTEQNHHNQSVEITFITRHLRIHVMTFSRQALEAMETPVQEEIIAERILQMLLQRASGESARAEVERHSHGNWTPLRDTGRLRDSITPTGATVRPPRQMLNHYRVGDLVGEIGRLDGTYLNGTREGDPNTERFRHLQERATAAIQATAGQLLPPITLTNGIPEDQPDAAPEGIFITQEMLNRME